MPREIKAWDVDGGQLRNGKRFSSIFPEPARHQPQTAFAAMLMATSGPAHVPASRSLRRTAIASA